MSFLKNEKKIDKHLFRLTKGEKKTQIKLEI